ncbi:YihY/virulence factor BrkB family protein [Prosthecomicrobium pneumaticum]|uniref:Membrane protein n=1 Tax=Prosthecomicrobium pneumaticum TaxID=81895 RepID=A0A7W9FLR0_9HYPH|nr:YhjD/YihY/BrkB family envelope integrity protein [Prosthecomicrobium pneumaticum]MBB5752998.1 membrane protein [Prosthecomicrobium pneumaticum]
MRLLAPRTLLAVAVETLEGFVFHRATRAANDIAVSAFIALFPFLIFVASLANLLRSPSLFAAAEQSIFVLWPTDIAHPLVRESARVINSLGGEAAAFSLAVAVWLSSNALEAVRESFDDAYEIVERRGWWRRRAESVVLVLLGAGFLLALAWIVGFLSALPLPTVTLAPLVPQPVSLARMVQVLSGLVVYLGLLVACHRRLVHGGRSFKAILPGIGFTLVLSAAATWGFALWTSRIVDYRTTYGSLAIALATLVLFVLLAATLVLGAELNAAIERVRDDRAKGPRLLSWARY